MTLHCSFPLSKDHSISFSDLILKLENAMCMIKSDYFMLVGTIPVVVILVYSFLASDKFVASKRCANDGAGSQVQPN